ncbi:MAG: hypothetical protein WC454_05540 [Phycisphaerae bacterium]|jgi:RNA-splicing ligase RtcB
MDTRQVSAIIEAAAKKVVAIAPGTIIPHLALGEMLGAQRTEEPQKYYPMVIKLKRELQQQYGIFLRTETRVGYLVSKDEDAIDLCFGKMQAGAKKMRRAVAEAQYIRVDRIADEIKKTRTIQTAQSMASLIGMMRMGNVVAVELEEACPLRLETDHA